MHGCFLYLDRRVHWLHESAEHRSTNLNLPQCARTRKPFSLLSGRTLFLLFPYYLNNNSPLLHPLVEYSSAWVNSLCLRFSRSRCISARVLRNLGFPHKLTKLLSCYCLALKSSQIDKWLYPEISVNIISIIIKIKLNISIKNIRKKM